jgi:HD-like signal output (HDOD) protein
MELKAQDRCVDLREISELILGDLGAVLQIYRRAVIEDSPAEDRPARIEDCISNLGLQSCLEAIFSERAASDARPRDVREAWRHAREVADCCKQLATNPAAEVDPTEAYLVGLFHQLYSLPFVLGWGPLDSDAQAAATSGLQMAEDWRLPPCVCAYFGEINKPTHEQRWSDIVRRAHEMASGSLSDDSFIGI